MNSRQFNPRFWNSVGIVYAIAAVVIAISTIITWGSNSGNVHTKRFEYDFFATLTGQEMKYGKAEAKETAEVFLAIPENELDEHFKELETFRTVRNLSVVKARFLDDDLGNYGRLETYGSFFIDRRHDGADERHDFFAKPESLLMTKSVLKGIDIPNNVVVGHDAEIVDFGKNLPWLIVAQFIAFGIYAIATRFSSQLDFSSINYNPLSLPSGIGSKISVAFTLPGSLPLIVLIMVLTVMSQAVSSRASKGRASSAFRVGSDEDPSEHMKRSLERLKARVEGS